MKEKFFIPMCAFERSEKGMEVIVEIKNVVKKKTVNYPKMNEIKSKEGKRGIPCQIKKIGLVTLIGITIKNKVRATSIKMPPIDQLLQGGAPARITPTYIRVLDAIQIVSIIGFIIGIITLIKVKIKGKKENRTIKVNKIIKAILIISIVVFSVILLAKIWLDYRSICF